MKRISLLVVLLALSGGAWAASPWNGTWVMRDNSGFRLTMTVVETGGAWKITWKIPIPAAKGAPATYATMTADAVADGKEVPNLIDGKPTGQSMEIHKIDERHTHTVVKFQGKPTGISKSELSPDGKVIKTENDFSIASPNGPVGKQVQYWDRQ